MDEENHTADLDEDSSDAKTFDEQQEHLLFDSDTADRIRQAKKANQSQFVSHWEADEQDIESWSASEISRDPGKLLLTLAENGDLAEMQRLMDSQTDALARQKLLMYKDSDGYTV